MKESKKGYTDVNIKRIDDFLENIISKRKNGESKAELLSFASIELSINGACTRRCIFCPRVNEQDYPNILTSLDYDTYKTLIDSLYNNNYDGRISFSGFCEPLLTKNLSEYIEYARKKLPHSQIEVVSNADTISTSKNKFVEQTDSLISSGLSTLRISVYDGDNQFNKIQDFITYLPESNRNRVLLRKRYLSASENLGLTLSNRAGSVDLSKLQTKYQGESSLPLKTPCNYPFYKLLIDYNGDVLICSNDWRKDMIVGNITQHDIYDIWYSEHFEEARRKLSCSDRSFEPCVKCDVEGTLNGQSFFDNWVQTKKQ